MAERISTEESFIDYFIEQRGLKPSFLDRINQLIDWTPIEKILTSHFHKPVRFSGRPAYPSLPMFKLLLIKRWYGLSDRRLQEALTDRISFLRFSGFSFGSSIPAASTICRYRSLLIKKGLYHDLAARVEQDIQAKGMHIRTRPSIEAELAASADISEKTR